jgi:hypothetical protein
MENGAHPAANGNGDSTAEEGIEMTAVDISLSPFPLPRPHSAEPLTAQ